MTQSGRTLSIFSENRKTKMADGSFIFDLAIDLPGSENIY